MLPKKTIDFFDFRIIFCVVLVVFLSNFPNKFIGNDHDLIENWKLIQDVKNIPRFFANYIPPDGQIGTYTPLRTLFFAVNYKLWNQNPIGWHIMSIAIHLLGTFAVYRLTRLLLKNQTVSFFTALLFGLHPVQVESVSFISMSVDTIGVVFLFTSFYLFIRAIGDDGPFAESRKAGKMSKSQSTHPLGLGSLPLYGLALVTAGLAIYSYELVLTLPLLFLFYDAYFSGPKMPVSKILLRSSPFFLIATSNMLLKNAMLGALTTARYLNDSAWLTLLVVIKALGKYVLLTLFPFTLTHNHIISKGIFAFNVNDFDKQAVLSQTIVDPQVLASLVALIGLAACAVYFYNRKPLITFCVGWFLLCLTPAMQIIPGRVYFSERFLYPGIFAFSLLLAALLVELSREKKGSQGGLPLGTFLMIAIVIFYAGKTVHRNTQLKNDITLYESAIKANPQSAMLRHDLGVSYLKEEKWNKAQEYFKQAIKLKPDEPHFYFSIEEAYSKQGLHQEGINSLKKAIELNPEFAEAYFNLAGIHAYIGDAPAARSYLQKSLELHKKQNRILEAGQAYFALTEYLKNLEAIKAQKALQTPQEKDPL